MFDKRNSLVLHLFDQIEEIKPKCILIENVPQSIETLEKLSRRKIEELLPSYEVKSAVLNSSNFGVPQIRKRVFIAGFRKDLGVGEFGFPAGQYDQVTVAHKAHLKKYSNLNFVRVCDAIGDLPSLKPGQSVDGSFYKVPAQTEYQRSRRVGSIGVFNHSARSHSKEFLTKISVIRPGRSNATLPEEKRFSDNYFSQAYARLHKKGISMTITAHFRNPGSGRFTHYKDRRSLTIREGARLQSFDDKFLFYGTEMDQERHVGNAVPPLLAEALARHFCGIMSE